MAQIASGETPLVSTSASSPPEQPELTPRAEVRAARASGHRWRHVSRWLGLAIFLLGAAMLVYVFRQAFVGFANLSQSGYLSGQFNMRAGDTYVSMFQAAIVVFGGELLKVLYLLILGFIASAIAARGIQFFAASESIIDEAVVTDERT
jgi:hypothetical protein